MVDLVNPGPYIAMVRPNPPPPTRLKVPMRLLLFLSAMLASLAGIAAGERFQAPVAAGAFAEVGEHGPSAAAIATAPHRALIPPTARAPDAASRLSAGVKLPVAALRAALPERRRE